MRNQKDYGALAAHAEAAAAKSKNPVARTYWLLKAMEHRRAAVEAARPKRGKAPFEPASRGLQADEG